MSDKILLIMDRFRAGKDYRLANYREFIDKCKELHSNTEVFYIETPPEGQPNHNPTIDQIISKTGKPKAIMLWWTHVAPSDFTRHKAKVYTYITDCPSMNLRYHDYLYTHKVKFESVLFNYYTEREIFDSFFDTKGYTYYPDWAAHEFDYEAEPVEKCIDFAVSGNGSAEYPQRRLYESAVHKAKVSSYLNVSMRGLMNNQQENVDFRNTLLASRYTPHDGGYKLRVVPRYYESSFAKSVIISPDMGREFKENGFKDGKNCIITERGEFTPKYFEKVAKRDDYEKLANAAHRLVASRHTTTKRVEQFLEMAL
jgi:hypothetical protein